MNAEFAVVVREIESVYQTMLGDLFDLFVADVAKPLVPYFQGRSQFSVGSLEFGRCLRSLGRFREDRVWLLNVIIVPRIFPP
jgi:hypothetical protein